MARAELILKKLKESNIELGIALKPPALSSEIEKLESLLNQKLPKDFKEFYQSTNGFETTDNLFRIIPIQEIIQFINELGPDKIYFAEYMIYSDTWDIILNKQDHETYSIINSDHKSNETITLTNCIFDFIERYLKGEGVFGENGLYSWYEQLKNKSIT